MGDLAGFDPAARSRARRLGHNKCFNPPTPSRMCDPDSTHRCLEVVGGACTVSLSSDRVCVSPTTGADGNYRNKAGCRLKSTATILVTAFDTEENDWFEVAGKHLLTIGSEKMFAPESQKYSGTISH